MCPSYIDKQPLAAHTYELTFTYLYFIDPDNKEKIMIEGTMQLCQDLGIEPTQLEFLLVSYHLGSERMGEFGHKEFVQGMIRLQCDSISRLKQVLPSLVTALNDPESFRRVYSYAFLLGRQTGQKSLCKLFARLYRHFYS